MLEYYVLHYSEDKSMTDHWKTINLLKESTMVAACWNEISASTIDFHGGRF